MAKLTAHSEVGRLKSLIMKSPKEGFSNQEFVDKEWESLNFLAAPDYSTAVNEFDQLEQIIRQSGTEIHHLQQSANTTLDSVYCRDASIATDFGMIICNMGKEKRAGEPKEEQRFTEALGNQILGNIETPGTLEGGDMAWLDESTLAVGHTYRTNYEGIEQLKALLEPNGVDVLVAEMPHYRGPSDVFHLMSVLSPIDIKKAVVYSPLMPIHFRRELLSRNFELIEVPDKEFDSMGSNVLAIAPSQCVIVEGNPITKSRMEAAGCEVHEYSGNELSIKGGGGPTCLTRPLLREIES